MSKDNYFKQFPLSLEEINLFFDEFEPVLFEKWKSLSREEQKKVAINIENNHFDKFLTNKKNNYFLQDDYINLLSKPFVHTIEDVLMEQYHNQMSNVKTDYLKFSEKRDLNVNVNKAVIKSMEHFCLSVMALKQAYKKMLFRQISVDTCLFSLFDLESNYIRGNYIKSNYNGSPNFTREDLEQLVEEIKDKNENIGVFTFLKDFLKQEDDGFRYIGYLPNGMIPFIDTYISMKDINENAESDLKIINNSLIRPENFSTSMKDKFISPYSAIYYSSIFKTYYDLMSNKHFTKEKNEIDIVLVSEYEKIKKSNISVIKSIFKPLYVYEKKSKTIPLKNIITEEAMVYGLLIKNEAVKKSDITFIKKIEKEFLSRDEIILLKGFKDSLDKFDKDGELENLEKKFTQFKEDVEYIKQLSTIRDYIEQDEKEYSIRINSEKVNVMLYDVNSDFFQKEFKVLESYYNERDFNIKLQNTDSVKIKRYQDHFNEVLKNIDSGIELVFLNCDDENLDEQLNNSKSLWLDIKVVFKKDFKEIEQQQYFKIIVNHIKNSIGIIYSTCKINKEFLGEIMESEIQHQKMKNEVVNPSKLKAKTNKF